MLLEYRYKYCERCHHDFNWLIRQMITLIDGFNTTPTPIPPPTQSAAQPRLYPVFQRP